MIFQDHHLYKATSIILVQLITLLKIQSKIQDRLQRKELISKWLYWSRLRVFAIIKSLLEVEEVSLTIESSLILQNSC